MAWRDQLQRASFRGVNFAVETSDMLFGRRNQLHEYPLRDEPYAEDLGKKAREYTINAFVIGDDYISNRDALISAVEDNQTSGTLIHPTLGSKTVIPKDCRVIFDNHQGGIEYFVLTFIEAGTAQFPSSIADTQGLVDSFSTEAISAVLNSFSNSFSVSGFPDFVSSAAQVISGNFVTTILSLVSLGKSDSDTYSSYIGSANSFNSSLSSQVANPSTLGTSISGLITGLTSLYTSSSDAYKAQKSLTSFGDSINSSLQIPALTEIEETTPSRTQQAINQKALANLIKNSSAIEMARTTSEIEYASRQDALAARDEVADILDTRMLAMADAGDDDQYIALSKVRTAMIKDINTRGVALPELTTITTQDTIPALVFAYNQYEDASKDQEIIDRNHIRNPVFIPAETQLEVIVE